MNNLMWKNFEKVEKPPWHFDDHDRKWCFFARERTARQGYSYSEANGLISNLKKDVSLRGEYQWRYKTRAIQQFARELASGLSGVEVKFNICSVPSSKRTDDAKYDSRLEDVAKLAAGMLPNATYAKPLERHTTIRSAHLSGDDRPDIDEHYDSMRWTGEELLSYCFLIDDVVTTGSTFKACQRHFMKNDRDVGITGMFWCRTIWLPDEDDDDDDFDDF